jgi:hypothetical protein
MLRTIFAMGIADFLLAAASGTAQATPIAPLLPSYTVDLGILSDVAWRRCSALAA